MIGLKIFKELMKLADMYCEINLLKDCSKIIKKAITVSNVAFFYNKAIEYNAKELEEFCFQFALRHMIADTLLEDMNMQTKFMHKAATRSRVLPHRYRQKSSVLRKRYAETRNSRINEEHKMQKYENKILQCVLAKNIISTYLINWPFFRLQKPEFILQIHMVMTFYRGNSAIFVTKDKNVYSLNHSSKTNREATPKKMKELCGKNIRTFACGFGCILALTEEGEVYSCDFINSNRALMLIPEGATFTQVADLSEKCVVDIACKCRNLLALTSDGKVYAWELSNHGIKNYYIDDGAAFGSVPMQVKHGLKNKNVVHIACGSRFNIVITDENIIYGWGNNSSGQISTVQSHTCYVYPREIIRLSNKIVKVTCGNSHTLALTNKGEIYAWGKNVWGQIGVESNHQSCAPVMVNTPEMGKVLDIAALCDLSVAVGYDKTIYMWGQFCSYYCSNIPFPTKFLTIHDVFAYSDLKILHKPLTVFTNIEEELNILESIETAFDDPLTSDFTIQVKGQPIYVHKAILKIRSEYFKKMFQHDWAENIQSTSGSSSVLTVSDFSYIVYKAFLKYLYTATIDLPSENASELMELAHMYCETNLIKDCSEVIKKRSSLCQM